MPAVTEAECRVRSPATPEIQTQSALPRSKHEEGDLFGQARDCFKLSGKEKQGWCKERAPLSCSPSRLLAVNSQWHETAKPLPVRQLGYLSQVPDPHRHGSRRQPTPHWHIFQEHEVDEIGPFFGTLNIFAFAQNHFPPTTPALKIQ